MPFIADTPESLLNRSDSLNPATTCRGITSTGRPCRRPVPASEALGRLRPDDAGRESLYCWQHREQASLSTGSSPGPGASSTPILEERTSLDTLAERLGIAALSRAPTRRPTQGLPQRTSRPQKELQLCCCFRVPVEEVSAPPRPRPRPVQPPASSSHLPAGKSGKKPPSQHLTPTVRSSRPKPGRSGKSSGANSNSSSPHSSYSQTSQTSQYLALIPPSASPHTASLLMAELAKPISQQDEPGYIYMFWLTPESKPAAPPAETARSLLALSSIPGRPPAGQRRMSDVLASFAVGSDPIDRNLGQGSSWPGAEKILLKIGRANNVQRRLNEWQRQCGHHVSLIRYYPYVSSSSSTLSAATIPRKVPHSHKVERFVHIELAGLGLRVADRNKCAACGREHREWFEVDATRRAVADVDDVIKRWVAWDEAQE